MQFFNLTNLKLYKDVTCDYDKKIIPHKDKINNILTSFKNLHSAQKKLEDAVKSIK